MMSSESQGENDASTSTAAAPTVSRFTVWVALFVLSLISFLSLLGIWNRTVWDAAAKWALTVTLLSTIGGGLGTAGYLHEPWRALFLGALPEIILAGFVLVLWAAGLPVIMNPANALAVELSTVDNANLYFSSWACFVCSGWIAGSLVKEMFGWDLVALATPHVTQKYHSHRAGQWYALVAATLVAMSASVRIFRALDCKVEVMQLAPACRQTKFGIAAGVVGTVTSAGVTYMATTGKLTAVQEGISSIVMTIIWSFGLGYITFGKGPGRSIGNLYFATWACFVLSLLLFSESYRAYIGAREQQIAATSSEDNAPEEETNDIAVEEDPDL